MAKINAFNIQRGWIEVIAGPMFSGKSEELLRRISLLKYSEVGYLVFTPSIDTRSGAKIAKSRDGRTIETITVDKSIEMIEHINNTNKPIQLIAIDEAQFFDAQLSDVCNHLANNGYIVMVAGLDCDSFGKPFDNIGRLLASAERVTKLKAICVNCGANATFTDHLVERDIKNTIMVGDRNDYTAKCRRCHNHMKQLTSYLPKVRKADI